MDFNSNIIMTYMFSKSCLRQSQPSHRYSRPKYRGPQESVKTQLENKLHASETQRQTSALYVSKQVT